MMRLSISQMWLGIVLILLLWAIRVIGIDTFPVFVDETIHIHTGEVILQNRTPFYNVILGRQFSIWWMMLFQPTTANPIWVARIATVLAILPGFAALLNIARLLAGWRGMFVFGVLYLLSAYHMFFERLALADPIASTAVLLAIWFAFRLSRRISLRDAVLTGFWLFIAFGAKTSTVPYFGVPIAAALALAPNGMSWQKSFNSRLKWLAAALGTAFSLSALFTILLRIRDYDLITNSLSLAVNARGTVATAEVLSMQRVIDNALLSFENLAAYTGAVGLAALFIATLWLAVRKQWYLPLCILGPLGVIWINTTQETRYLVTATALLLLCGAYMLVLLIRQYSRLGWLVFAGIAIWGLSYWLPFVYRSPEELPLSESDRWQYVLSDASGFGFTEINDILSDQQPKQVIGALANCQGLRLTFLSSYPVLCPLIRPDSQDRETLAALFEANRFEGSYLVLEDSPYVPETAPGTLIGVVDIGRPRLSIYALAP